MARLEFTAKELAEKLGVSIGTFRNQYANNLERINKRLEAVGESFRVVEKKRIGKHVYFILSDAHEVPPSNFSAEGTSSIVDISKPVSPLLDEAGSPPPASSFSPALTEHEKEILNVLKEKDKREVWKRLVIAKDPSSVNQKAKKYGLPKSTISRWVKAYAEKGIIGLIPWRREPEEIPEKIKREAEKIYANSHITIRDIHRRLEVLMAELGEYVSYERLKKYLQELHKNFKYEVTLRKYGRSAAMKFTPKIGRWKKKNPFAVWQADHTRMDNWVVFSDGRVDRPWFSAVIDEATGYILTWEISERQPNARVTTFLFIDAIERWGLPEAVRIDRGKDFVSKRVESGFEALGVEVIKCHPRAPWEKGQVENLMGIIKKGFCPQLMNCYTYRNPRDREALPKEKVQPVPINDYIVKLMNYIKDRNAQIAHQKRLVIPEEPFGFNPLAYYYFLEEKERTVDRGEIHIDGITYRAKELLDSKWFGEKVICKLDDEDASHIWVFTPEGDFICEAFADGSGYQVPLEVLRDEKKKLAKNRKVIAKAREEIVKVKTKQKAREFQDLKASQESYARVNQSKTEWDRSLRELERIEKPLEIPEVFRSGEVITFLYENRNRISEIPEWVIEKFNEIKVNPRYSRIYKEEIKAVEEALTSSTKGVK
ncbi:transposase [Desulfurobacterium crinifex]